jgi:ribonuclease P protein component
MVLFEHAVSEMSVSDQTFSSAHVAFAVPRTVGTAVVRNRIRRRVREILRARSLSPGLYLWGVAPGAAGMTSGDLARHVDTVLAKGQARSARVAP